jgi:hypothetical protein
VTDTARRWNINLTVAEVTRAEDFEKAFGCSAMRAWTGSWS